MQTILCLTGIDGCGKGTHVSLLLERLQREGIPAFYSKAYSDLEKERFAFLMPRYSDRAVMFLFQAFHAEQHVRAMEALERGEVVIADRWDEAYLAYHGSTRSFLSAEDLRAEFRLLNQLAFQGRKPTRTVMLDVPVDVAEKRTHERGPDYFDKLGSHYHALMRDRYLSLARSESWIVLDGTYPVEDVHEQLWDILVAAISS